MMYLIRCFVTAVFSLLLTFFSFSQDVTLNSQADVDAFDPNTTMISGNLLIETEISSNPITDLSNLSNLTSVGGDLEIIDNNYLTNIDGLVNLTTISGYLDIENNSGLSNLVGLSSLISVGNYLNIEYNSALVNLEGLSSLNSVGDYFKIENNPALLNLIGLSSLASTGSDLKIDNNYVLSSLDGLSSLTSIGGILWIEDNPSLLNINGLSNLMSIVNNCIIRYNDALLNIDGLSNLTFIGNSLGITDSPALLNINGLSGLTSITNNCIIRSNDALLNLDGLSNLTSVGNTLAISWNPSLSNLDSFSSLTSIGDGLYIVSNATLTNIDGLSNLTFIGGYCQIRYNTTLLNLDGLLNLTFVGSYLEVRENSSLVNCCGIQQLLENPDWVEGSVTISNNPSACSNETEILNAICGLSMIIFNDVNQNCINDNDEIGIANRQFIIQPGDIIGQTDINGSWNLDYLPLGNYTITIDTSGAWSPTCPITQSFIVTEISNETISFGLSSTEPCTAPNISIHMPFMRPCFENQRIHIQACNTNDATGALEDAYVVLELDSLLIPTLSSIPYTDLGDHMYQFDIGTVNPGICVDFWMETMLSCEAELGQGLCMEANLFPAADCVFDDIPNYGTGNCETVWDLSSLAVEGYCENDSVYFQITNIGTGDMTCFSLVRIYINGNAFMLDSVQLTSGEMASFVFDGQGQSWRLETDQHPLHPGDSQPNAMIEDCGGSAAAFASFVNAMSLDDADPVVDIYCGIVTGSYDPNDKTGFPLGINESNDILPNQQIEYLIRFQNTGTDTAFTVVIRDTLSPDFDIFSVQSGVASHPYEFTISDSRAMEWTFNDILLVDSFTNEPGSHGFIKFTVNQIPDLAEETILENTAAIYFDFNDPIITNTSQHTISYFLSDFITTDIEEIQNNEFAASINIYPNPTSDHVSVDLGKDYQEASFTLRNILGQTVFQKNANTTEIFQFEINGAVGIYLLEIKTKTGEFATFKVLKK